jgi:plasmid stabilization system protein ParE
MRLLIVRAEAEADIEEAFRWYEERSLGLGAEFLRAVEAALSGVEREPERYPEVHKRARRALLRRFPYAIYNVVHSRVLMYWPAWVRADTHAAGTVAYHS